MVPVLPQTTLEYGEKTVSYLGPFCRAQLILIPISSLNLLSIFKHLWLSFFLLVLKPFCPYIAHSPQLISCASLSELCVHRNKSPWDNGDSNGKKLMEQLPKLWCDANWATEAFLCRSEKEHQQNELKYFQGGHMDNINKKKFFIIFYVGYF